VTLAFYFTVRGFSREWLLIPAGLFAGLAYMTKLSGLALPIAFLAAALAVWRWRALRMKYFYLYFAAFVAAASPLLARNAVAFHNPFSSPAFAMAWLEKKADAETMDYLEGRTGARDYFSRNGAVEVGLTFVEGGESVVRDAFYTLCPIDTHRSSLAPNVIRRSAGPQVGMIILAIAIVVLLLDVDPGRRAFSCALGGIAFVAMAWYAKIASEPRSILPFMPIILAYAAAGAVNLVRAWPYRAAAVTLACACALALVTVRLDILRPFQVKMPGASAVALADWMSGHAGPADVVLIGPDDTLRLDWYRETHGVPQFVPNTRTIEALVDASRSLGARYVVISRGLERVRILQFSTSFDFDNDNLRPTRAIPGWREVWQDPVPPVDYVVFEVEKGPAAETASGEGSNGK
jgi:hypothetical protein